MKVLYKFNYQYDSRNRDFIDYEKEYGFMIGNEYEVLGKGLFKESKKFIKNTIYFLIKINNKIDWFPEFLFVQNTRYNKFPFNWHINFEKNELFYYIMGYYELCNNMEHFLGLLSKNKKDIEIFERRYNELVKWEKILDYYNREVIIEDILAKIK